MPESWSPILGYEGRWEASTEGRIKSLPRRRTRGGVLGRQRRPRLPRGVEAVSPHTPYYVNTAGVMICVECSQGEVVLWADAHPASPPSP